MKFLVDENMPRDLAPAIAALGFQAQDIRDIGLGGRPDTEVVQVAIQIDVILITRDRGLADPRSWPDEFTAGAIFVNLPSDTTAPNVNAKILDLISHRLPESLLGAITSLEPRRALSRPVRRRT